MIVVGFGSVEDSVRAEVKRLLAEKIGEGLRGTALLAVLDRYNKPAGGYDKLPRDKAPERYTRVYWYDDALHFNHVNRQHGLSPDGWALWQVTEPFPFPET